MTNLIYTSLGIIGGFLTAILTSYFTTKGKYWADSESLPNLTKEIEEVKGSIQRELLGEIEKLKAEMSILTNRKNELFKEEKETISNFYSSYSLWLYYIENEYFWDYDHTNYHEIDSIEFKLDGYYRDVIINHSRLVLFIKDKNVEGMAEQLITSTVELQELVLNSALELQFLLEDEDDAVAEYYEGKNQQREFEKYEEYYIISEILPENGKRKKELNDKHKEKFDLLWKKVEDHANIFVITAKNFIRGYILE